MNPKITPPREDLQLVKFCVFKCGQTKKTFFACQWVNPKGVLVFETGRYRVVNSTPLVSKLISFIREKDQHLCRDEEGKIYDRWYETKKMSGAERIL